MDDEDIEDVKKPSELAKLNEFGCYEEPDGGVFIDDVYIAPPPPPALTFENDRPRMIITHIECHNFKSYAGTQHLGPFHKSFTSIVGPNGSGKSNVIDSMLFVFGYRAQKIRSKKISVLIHSSQKYNDLQSCTVRVFFQEIIDQGEDSSNSEGYEVVPNSQIVVSRTAMKDNTSYYEINGKRKKFGDVASLLKEKGIDLDHNRFLILQGEVEQIALMKPKALTDNEVGMLEFLENIIGSHRFKEAIEKLKVVHNQLDESRNEKLNRVKLVEKEKEALEKPKEEALHLVHQLNSITRLKNQLFQLRIYLSEKAVEETQAKKIEFERSCSELMEKLKAITEEKAVGENAVKEMADKLDKMVKDFETDKDLLKSHSLRHDKICDELKILNAKRKKAKQNKEQEEARFEKLEKVPEENKLKIDELTEHRTKLEAQYLEEKNKKDKALKDLQAETQEFQDKKEQLETQLMSLQKNENDKQALYDVAKSELDLLKSTEMKEQVKLEQMQQKYDSAINELAEKEPKLDEHSEKIPALRSQTEKSKLELSKLNQEYDALSKKVHDTRVKVDETRSKQSAEKHGNRVLEALMRQKSIGALPGIYGRLGNLGGINQKYDVAISTAAGSGLDRILVDTLETATACIKYLKDNDIGRADMLVLESTVHLASKVNCNFKAPGNVPRLIDLVEVNDPKLKTAFYHYMRDTLVADNLKQAREIAYGAKRFRVVTLDGEIIEVSGAMSGGGGAKSRGKMGTQVISQVNETEFRKMENTLEEAEEKLRSVSEKKAQEEHKIALCTREINERSRSFEKLKLEVARLKNESGLLKEQIEAQKKIVKESKPDMAKVKTLEEKVDGLLKDFEEATENSRDIREGVKEMNKKIQHIQNSKVKSISNKLNDVSSKLDKVKGEITRLQVGIRNSDRDLAKSKDNLEALSVEIKGLEKEMTEANQMREQIKNDAQELTEKCDRSEEEMIEIKKQLKGTRESLKKIEEKENSYKSEKIEFDQQLGNFKAEINKSKVAGKHWRRERGNLRFEDVPGAAPEDLELVDVPVEELENLDDDDLQNDIDKLIEETKDKPLNLVVIEQYREKENLYMDRVMELEEATNLRDLKKKLLEDIKKKRQDEFSEGFGKITLKLKEMYQTITDGGDAELEFVDTLDPFAEGIVFSVRPPKKSWKNISNLSGGEKTLSSLALVFALHYYKPTPLYVMDEIDAALDFKNVSIVSHYIKERTKNAQFIIISLRANMFELADRLVGIYKTNNATKSITINPNDVVEAS